MSDPGWPPPPPVTSPSPGGDAGWQRLHPATILEILFRQLPQMMFAVVLVLNGAAGGFDGFETLVGIVVLGPAVIAYVSARYRLDDERIYYRKGVIKRHSRELPRNQIQSVETSMTIFGRIFGLETLTISTAGGGDSEIEIGLLSIDAANWLRHQLTPTPDLPAPAAGQPLASVDAPVPVPETVIAALASGDWWRVVLSRPGIRGLALAAESFELRAVRFGDRIRTRHGLFRIRTQETRVARVQGVLALQGVVARRIGVETLVIDTADASGAGAATAMLVNPIAPAGHWLTLAADLLGANVAAEDLVGVAPAARRRLQFRALRAGLAGVFATAAIAGVAVAGPEIALITNRVVVLAAVAAALNLAGQFAVAELRFRHHRYTLATAADGTHRHLAVCSGGLSTRSLALDAGTTQSVTVSSNWFQRRLDLATVTADTTTRSLAPARVTDITRADAGHLAGKLLS